MLKLSLFLKQFGKCKRCHRFMYWPTRWFHNTPRAATFEHIIDLEFLDKKNVADKENLVLYCKYCNDLKSHAKMRGTPFIKIFNNI